MVLSYHILDVLLTYHGDHDGFLRLVSTICDFISGAYHCNYILLQLLSHVFACYILPCLLV